MSYDFSKSGFSNYKTYGIIDKKSLILSFNDYEIDETFKNMLQKFNYK